MLDRPYPLIQFKSIAALAILAVALAFVPRASAHALDTGLVVDSAPVGPFDLSVWSISSSVDGLTLHLSSRLVDAATGAPIPAARLEYKIENLGGDGVRIVRQSGRATPSNGFLYEANVDLPDPGSYRITVMVNGGNEAGGEVAFIFPVYPAAGLMRALVYALLILSLAATGWLIKEGLVRIFQKRRAI